MTGKEIREAYDELIYMNSGEEKARRLEVLIAKMPGIEDDELEFELRNEWMVNSFELAISPETQMVHFAWMLQYEQKNPSDDITYQVMWYYKWVINSLVASYHISREQIEGLLEDMAKRYEDRQFGKRPIYDAMRGIYMVLGDKALVEKYHKLHAEGDSSEMDDCQACQINNGLSIEIYLGNYEKAIEQAKPLIERQYTCEIVPMTTYPSLIEAHIKMGNWEPVEALLLTAIEAFGKRYDDLGSWGSLLLASAGLGKFDMSREIIENCLPLALRTNNYGLKYAFFSDMTLFLELLIATGNQRIILSPSLQKRLLAAGIQGDSLEDYHRFFEHRMTAIGTKFNERNGNQCFDEDFKKDRELLTQSPVMRP